MQGQKKKISTQKYLFYFIRTPIAITFVNVAVFILVIMISRQCLIGEYIDVSGVVEYSDLEGYSIVLTQDINSCYEKGVWYFNNPNIRHDCVLKNEGKSEYKINDIDVKVETLSVGDEVNLELRIGEISLFDYWIKGKNDD